MNKKFIIYIYSNIFTDIKFLRKEKSINLTENAFEFCYLIHFNNIF